MSRTPSRSEAPSPTVFSVVAVADGNLAEWLQVFAKICLAAVVFKANQG